MIEAPENRCPHSRVETCVWFHVASVSRRCFVLQARGWGAGSGRILLSFPQTSKGEREGLGFLTCVLHLFTAGLCHIPIMTSLRCRSSVKVPLSEERALDAKKVKPESN